MDCTRRRFVSLASGAALLGLVGCANANNTPATEAQHEPEQSQEEQKPEVDVHKYDKLALDAKAWKYDADNDVYYQLGVPYCLEPASASCESLAIFVPGAYFTAKESGRSLYECEVNPQGKVGDFTPATAPVLMPINSGTLGAQTCPTAYSFTGLGNYLAAGYVYVYAGFRGRSSAFESGSKDVYAGGDPWPVVDLKAAVRFLRYNAKLLPFEPSRIFSFGFSAGGGVSAVLASSGDSELYTPYLATIGAAEYDAEGNALSDAICGSATWCPITSFDTADASYEWMMGQYASEGTRAEGTWTKLLSNDLARKYAAYINDMDLRDAEDNRLTLDETSGELYADGSYYTHLVECIEGAATTFFANTTFPYTYTPQHLVNANFPGDPSLQSVGTGAQEIEAVTGDASAQAAGVASADGGDAAPSAGTTQVQSVVYNTADDYANALNGDAWWFTYNQTRGTVRLTSLGDFIRHLKLATKDVCAFDAVDRSSIVNQLFGVDEKGGLHFSQTIAEVLVDGRATYAKGEGWNEAIVDEWVDDLSTPDALGTNMGTRMNMFNPLYFLSGRYEGFGTAKVAPHWRINSGVFQTDTSLCTELNLALALGKYEGVKNVAFTPVWGQGHVLAEVSGSAETNLINWVKECCK